MGIHDKLSSIGSMISQLLKKELKQPTLVSLAPNDDIEDNQYYVDLLAEQVDKAFNNDTNKNIALAGEYGTGKSSIIRKFIKTRKKRVVVISFATLNSTKDKLKGGVEVPNKTSTKAEETNQAVGDLPLYADSYGPADRTEANGIQKEIVKQLMFREKSSSLPHSKFSRAGKPNKLYSAAITFVLCTVGTIFLFSPFKTAYADVEKAVPEGLKIPLLLLTILMLLISVCCSFYVVLRTAGKLGIDKVGGNNLSMSFAVSKNYFDDYLDEIIYLFEENKFDIVIFEDLDRFYNILIFERLRALNTALNHAEGLKKRTVRFIYAIRDSLFDNPDISDAAVSRAKFFDIIIPVVPFLTFENSLKYFEKNLPKDKKIRVSNEVLRIASQHITDMRLIHDICNEFKVFVKQLNIESSSLGLSADGLFAMIVLKSKYPTEFSSLKDRSNFIEELATAHNSGKRGQISQLQMDIDKCNLEIREGAIYSKKIEDYSSALNALIDGLIQDESNFTATLLDESENAIDRSFFNKAFWNNLQEKDPTDTTLQIRWSSRNYPFQSYPQYSHIQIITKKLIEDFIGEEILLSELTKSSNASINEQIGAKKRLIRDIRFCSMKDHIILEANHDVEASFTNSLPKDKPLLSDFIKAGYVDDYYLQYYSTYEGNLSRDALHYCHEFIERGLYDMTRRLSETDVKELLKSLDEAYLSGPGMFNVDIVDYLIRRNDTKVLSMVIFALIENSDTARIFIDEYQKSTKRDLEFKSLIRTLSSNGYSDVFDTISSLTNISNQRKYTILNAAIEGFDTNKDYTFNDKTVDYITEEIHRITPLTKNTKDPIVPHLVNAINILLRIGRRVDLQPLNQQARDMVIKSKLFRITEGNMRIAVGVGTNYSLDKMRYESANGNDLYEYMLDNLDEYVTFIKRTKGQHTLSGISGFEEIINDIYDKDEPDSKEFIELVDSSNCIVDDINSLTKNVWTKIIGGEHVLVQPSLQNIIDYHIFSTPEEGSELDESLADYLSIISGEVSLDKKYDEYDETSRNSLLRTVMNSSRLDVHAKVNFVVVLFKHRSQTINIKFFDLQDGELYGELLKRGVLSDAKESYEYIMNQTWETKEHYLSSSKQAKDYIEDIVEIDDINNILKSGKVGLPVKMAIVKSYSLTQGILDKDAAQAYCDLVVQKEITPNPQVIENIASNITSLSLINIVNLLPKDTDQSSIKKIFAESTDVQLNKISSQTRKRISLDDSERSVALLNRLKSLNIIRSYGKNWLRAGLSADIVE